MMTEVDAARLVRGSVYLAGQSVVTTLIGAVALAFTARILTQVEMGVAVVLMLTLGLAQVVTDLGFSGGLTKFVAEFRGRGEDFTSMSFGAVGVKVLMAGAAAMFCVVMAPWLSELLLDSGEFVVLFQLLGLNVLTFCVRLTVHHLLLGVNRLKELAILTAVAALVGKVFAVGLLVLGYGLVGLVLGWTLGELAYVLIGGLIIVRNRYVKIQPFGKVIPHLRTLARFSWPLLATNVVLFLYGSFDQAFLLFYVPLDEVAVYSIALRAFGVISLIPLALSSTLFPYYSEQRGRDEQQNIVAGVRGSSRYIALCFTPLALGLMATANPAITFFAGQTYASGDVVLAILCIFGGLSSLAASFSILLLVYDMTPTVLAVNITSVIGSVILLPVLLPSLGVVGMALAKGVATIIAFVLTVLLLRRRMSLQFDGEALWKSWAAAVAMFGIVWLLEYMYMSPYLLPLYVGVGGLVYVVGLRLLKAVRKGDVSLIRNLLGKRAAPIMNLAERILI
ncbi:MAG: oligosaccharide flippase family protein [Candidatus Bathyarchaeota archaeon]|nr:MAG: oligosaccharide flippase family protein [Candidatus Bathyarchaeota archaeon]